MPSDIYRRIYRQILEEKEEKGQVQPAALVSRYAEDEESSKLVAAVFSRTLREDMEKAEKSRILSENLQRLRKESLKNALKSGGDAARTAELVKEMARIGTLAIRESDI